MKSKTSKNVLSLILLLIFLSSSYLCYSFGAHKTKIIEDGLKKMDYPYGKWKGIDGDDLEHEGLHALGTASGYNGAAIGFGIIAGSSLLSLSFLVNAGTTQKEF